MYSRVSGMSGFIGSAWLVNALTLLHDNQYNLNLSASTAVRAKPSSILTYLLCFIRPWTNANFK